MMSLSQLNTFILDLDYAVFIRICRCLDIESKYRDVVDTAADTCFRLEMEDVEKFARATYGNGSPSEQLLKHWGNQMRVRDLIFLLDRLRLERCQLDIREPESLLITRQPVKRVQVNEGERFLLTCEAVGFPYPHFSWFHMNNQLTSNSHGILEITNVSLQHAGNYICRIHHLNHRTNDLQYLFTDWCDVVVNPCQKRHLQAEQRPAVKAFSTLKVIRHPLSQVIRRHTPLLLSCEALGSGVLEYHWVKNKSLISSGSGSRYTVLNANTEDSGEYYCVVKNECEEVHSEVAVITVEADRGLQASDKPEIVLQPVDCSCDVGGTAVFRVKAQYNSQLRYQWYHRSEPIKDTPGATEPELRVEIKDVYDAGRYQCRVYAADGKDVLSRAVELTVPGKQKTYTAADKLALIIGVSTYRSHGGSLPAVEHDIQATVEVLEKMKFKVVSLLDLTLIEMKNAVTMFCDLLSQDVYAVFYCAGHGFMGNDGRHYLIPWDACHIASTSESLCIEDVQDQIQLREPKLLMFFLDICRRNNGNSMMPRRMSESTKAVANKIVIYAASKGQQAYEESGKLGKVPRGLFSKCLLEVIDKPVGVVGLYTAIIDKFKNLPYNRDQFCQCPEISTNQEEYDRSLLDPIDFDRFSLRIVSANCYWRLAHVLPNKIVEPVVITVPTTGNDVSRRIKIAELTMIFERVTSNVMDMRVIVTQHQLVGGRAVVKLIDDDVPASVRPVTMPALKNRPCESTCYRFSNLQRLQTSLIISFNLILSSMNPDQQRPDYEQKIGPFDLGRPLVSVVDLGWQNHLNEQHAEAKSTSELSLDCFVPIVENSSSSDYLPSSSSSVADMHLELHDCRQPVQQCEDPPSLPSDC